MDHIKKFQTAPDVGRCILAAHLNQKDVHKRYIYYTTYWIFENSCRITYHTSLPISIQLMQT